MATSIPIVILGQNAGIAKGVIATVAPEYEGMRVSSSQAAATFLISAIVVHLFLDHKTALVDLPPILRGESLPPSGNLGTQNYSRPVTAVVTGAFYDDRMFNELREACKGITQIPWLRPDLSSTPSIWLPGLGRRIGLKAKAGLKKVAEEDKMGQDGVHFY
ncbi:hypothetical protein F5884DRAFT_746268 [Xylogone sp. PMI_703]|nr:hypothetical protein F5884DRAFT_746268 [Xylogone sp. PMI_703]